MACKNLEPMEKCTSDSLSSQKPMRTITFGEELVQDAEKSPSPCELFTTRLHGILDELFTKNDGSHWFLRVERVTGTFSSVPSVSRP